MFRLAAAILTISALPAFGSQCIQLAHLPDAKIWNASVSPDEVQITFVGHSAFRIETGQGRVAVTDFYGDPGPGKVPDAVTMNHAHSSHWTAFPPEEITHHLRGWGDEGEAAEHWVQLDDLLIRNIPTDIRDWGGEWERDGNSIFVFEYEGLCIGHLGHLHHTPTEEDFAMIGRLDIVLAPVDGGYTMPIDQMIEVMQRVRARVIIPMHIFRSGSLERFLTGMSDSFEIDFHDGASITYSARTLPAVPTIKVMAPAVRDGGFGIDDGG
ncbi:MAG: MBL fold metallo-hydrolase [Pseudomonadota bacterium]